MCQVCVRTWTQVKQQLLWVFSFPLFNHETGCFEAMIHTPPEPSTPPSSAFQCPLGPSTSCTRRDRKQGDTGAAQPVSEILTQIQWLPCKAVTDLCEQPSVFLPAHRKQYDFLERKMVRQMM